MAPTRREFMRQAGVFFATLIASGCAAPRTPAPTPGPPPTPLANDARWRALRASWLELKDPQLQAYEDTDFSRRLRQQHAETLATLTETGLIDSSVAADIQVAFEQAIAHIQRQQATCYRGVPIQFQVYESRQDVLTQAVALTEMAQRSDLDPATVERAHAALARDMAWLAQFQAGQEPGDLADIQATPTEIEAARILAELLAATD